MVMDSYRTPPEPLKVSSRAAMVARMLRFMMHARLYSCEALLQRLPQDFEHMAAALRQLIQKQHAVMCE